ncbi:uncharacterized protein BDR25DRAFT_110184 [Lindgomyces ingoldianus]|uniref:Uncharacterized protein n=1 Tax=Lindgomyces ingoldianus TaxID=673940 RepID=A0ACB6R773_9PLEO|nr:uncharacterized protein BDR25DRAFT_110184 [Lindgomyces ingoldianus]KAF2474595.1 hypothetical protein BDR25DRAFT_110184 [Lindgomyces ingoldianus]
MAANNEKPITFGATIVDATGPAPPLRSAPSNESNLSSASAAEKDVGIDSSNPFSAFYKHPEARRSMDGNPQESKTHLDVGVYERDLEAGLPLSAATTQQPKVSVDGRVKECTMWPSRQAMMEKKKQTKRAKGCNLFRNLNSKQRLWVKIIIALLVVGAAVGLGVGVSRAVGGGVWSGDGHNHQIPNN